MRRASESGLAAAALAALLTLASTGRAQPDAAARAYEQATELFEQKDYQKAAALFEISHRASPHAATALMAGISWERAGSLARAADRFQEALDLGGLDPKHLSVATERLTAVKPKLGLLEARGPAGSLVSVGHAEQQPLPLRIHLEPGTYDVVVRHRDGVTERREATVESQRRMTIAFDRPAPAPPPPPPTALAPPARPHPAAPIEAAIDDGPDPMTVAGAVMISVGGAGAIAAITLGALTMQAKSEWDDGQHTLAVRDAYDRAISLRLATNIAAFGAGIVGGVGILLLAWPKDDGEEAGAFRFTPLGATYDFRF